MVCPGSDADSWQGNGDGELPLRGDFNFEKIQGMKTVASLLSMQMNSETFVFNKMLLFLFFDGMHC